MHTTIFNCLAKSSTRRHLSTSTKPTWNRLIRFTNKSQVYFGEPIMENANIIHAKVLKGSEYLSLTPTNEILSVETLLPPIVPPIFLMIGLNYKRHAEEAKLALPLNPVLFTKPRNAVNSTDSNIIIPKHCQNRQADYEVELAVVIGKSAKNVKKENALDHVLGYTVANDVSARKWQGAKLGGTQWTFSKSFDGWCPLGAVLTSRNVISQDPAQLPLRISTKLNGEIMQDSMTSDMIFSVSEIIAFLSQGTTLEPGTVICTGTPEGVGFARKPEPIYLQDGDKLEMSIEEISTLRNTIVFEK